MNGDGDDIGTRAARAEEIIVVMRNDLTVIRGQAQLMQRALSGGAHLDACTVRDRLDVIIHSVDEASLELQHLQPHQRPRHRGP